MDNNIDQSFFDYIEKCNYEYEQIIKEERERYNCWLKKLQDLWFTPYTAYEVTYAPHMVSYIEMDEGDTISFSDIDICVEADSENKDTYLNFRKKTHSVNWKNYRNIVAVEEINVLEPNTNKYLQYMDSIKVIQYFKSELAKIEGYRFTQGLVTDIFINPQDREDIMAEFEKYPPEYHSETQTRNEFMLTKGLERRNGNWFKIPAC